MAKSNTMRVPHEAWEYLMTTRGTKNVQERLAEVCEISQKYDALKHKYEQLHEAYTVLNAERKQGV